jgi:hypothetical protein
MAWLRVRKDKNWGCLGTLRPCYLIGDCRFFSISSILTEWLNSHELNGTKKKETDNKFLLKI